MPSQSTRPRLTFVSSDGATVFEGNPQVTAIEMIEGFVEDKLFFGSPPFVISVEDVPADTPDISSISDEEAARDAA
jgi:hypothetical protein